MPICDAQPLGGLARDELADAGDLERRALDGLGDSVSVRPPGGSTTTARTTPGPEMPTLMTTSGSPVPCTAPAMNGLSSTMLANTTSLAQPMQSRSRCARRVALITSAMRTHGVHVDARAGGRHVDRGAYALAWRERRGNRAR